VHDDSSQVRVKAGVVVSLPAADMPVADMETVQAAKVLLQSLHRLHASFK
jgi:hypothetical protein